MNKAQRAGSVIGGLGVVFLSQNLMGLGLGNWWALFLLGPGGFGFGPGLGRSADPAEGLLLVQPQPGQGLAAMVRSQSSRA